MIQKLLMKKQLMNDESQDLNEMITDLENRRKMAETEYLEMRHFVSEAQELHDDLKEAYSYFRRTKRNGKEKANEVVSEAEEKAKIIADIRKCNSRLGKECERASVDRCKDPIRIYIKTENKVLKKAKEQKR